MIDKYKLHISISAAIIALFVFTLSYVTFFCSAYDDVSCPAIVLIYEDDNVDNIVHKLHDVNVSARGFSILATIFNYKVSPGRYAIYSGESIFTIFRRIRNAQQDPVNLVIPSVRTIDRLAGYLGEHLQLDSITLVNAFNDSSFVCKYGYTPETLPALFIPNTYQFYWNVSLDDFMDRMAKENDNFWTEERVAKACEADFTKVEICTLASIVDEETANNKEKPMVAGMYINRLHINMPLQADPTVKFAVGDFSLRRIYHNHLTTDSPYNTYMYEGLPPGPIRIPSIAGIDAVLNYVHHNYIYMCAKEDFSGTHNFASNYNEHLRNAHKYSKALNERGIK